MPCPIKDDNGDWSAPVMLIMRGNAAGPGVYEDENGKTPAWPKGALHDGAAIEYARLLDFNPKVLDVTGSSNHGNRDTSEGTVCALECFRNNTSIVAFYGFSGGGYNLYHILTKMTEDERRRVDWVAVVGVDPDAPPSIYERRNFKGGRWTLDYMANSGNHMFLPEKFLKRAENNKKKK
jgi:hypothetical protein